ncbi:Up-regulated during septation-domain-containing protein [Mycena polygramma]|nr:Up-regulated during septation-domain-containing protein [Mycena polygramma]
MNIRDELLISLLASEAVVDSRDFEILSSEEVDALKKEQQVLMSRQGAMAKKLTLETKIRDAALSLNAAHKKVSKHSAEQLDAANKRVDTTEREVLRVSDRVNGIHKRFLEHRAGVLSFSVRTMERKMAPPEGNPDSGYNTPSGVNRSPTGSSVPGRAPASRFDEKDAVEAARADELRHAQDAIAALERELPRLEGMDEEMQTLAREKAACQSNQKIRTRQLALQRGK